MILGEKSWNSGYRFLSAAGALIRPPGRGNAGEAESFCQKLPVMDNSRWSRLSPQGVIIEGTK